MPEYTLPCMLERDTVSLGKKIGLSLFPSAFIALYGDLGSGKTTLAKAIATGLGVEGALSPTFTILKEYNEGRIPLYHFDAYRLENIQELVDIGYFDYCYKPGVVLMEWADKVQDALPKERLDIRITGSGLQYRTMLFTPHGSSYTDLLKETVI